MRVFVFEDRFSLDALKLAETAGTEAGPAGAWCGCGRIR